MLSGSLILNGIIFSTTAALLLLGGAWWLYLSPVKMKNTLEPRQGLELTRLSWPIGIILGIAAVLMVVGALWDASMHIQTGVVPGGDDFLWPPHLMIYGGFLLAFLTSLATIAVIARSGLRSGSRDPRVWIRQNPSLGAVALATFYTLVSIPGDAIWHELFGIDLTAWSPPHILIALMMSAVPVSAATFLLQNRPPTEKKIYRGTAVLALLALMLNILYIVGVLEWELREIPSQFTLARPIWVYPLVGGAVAFLAFFLARKLTGLRWAAMGTALIFFGIRFLVTAGLDLTGQVSPFLPLPFFLGALFVDLIGLYPRTSRAYRLIAPAAAFTAGYLALALPTLSNRANLPAYTPLDGLFAIGTTLMVSLLLAAVINGGFSRRERKILNPKS